MLALLVKAGSGLFDQPTYIRGHVRKDGGFVKPHIAKRKRTLAAKAPPQGQLSLFDDAPAPVEKPKSKLDAFIAKHGGAEHLRGSLEGMTADQRAKLIDAMAHLEGVPTKDVIDKLGMSVPKPEPAEVKGEPHYITESELRAAAAAELEPEGPQEGDTKTEEGVEYQLRGGRWWRTTPDEDVESAEDRADLAEAMAKDPHSDETKELLAKLTGKSEESAPPPEDDLDPSSPNYRYRDTGYVAGSRKEMAATMIRSAAKRGERVRVTDIDWDSLEENPREAKDLITKANLFGGVDWQGLRDLGFNPGAAFLIAKVYASVGSEPPEDLPQARRDYAVALTTLRDRLEDASTVEGVLGALALIQEERDGTVLNEAEAAAYAEVNARVKAEYEVVRAIDDEHKALQKRRDAISNNIYSERREVQKRRDRGWQVDPAKEALIVEADAELAKMDDLMRQYREQRGMNPIRHENSAEERQRGIYTTRLEYPYKAAYEAASRERKAIQLAAMARNALENEMTRSWKRLGKGFNAVIDYRSHTGSEAFRKHVATVKAGRVDNWDWAEKDTAPRGASKRSTTFQLQVADEIERVGGPEIAVDSTAALKDQFDLREVQSGNWVLDDPNSAKFHVERCAEGFADLADILGIPREQISFNGRLAMAFGARGKGGAKAHYEPIERVINMTKMAGAGSLAHEWFHMVDNLAAEAVSGVATGSDFFCTVSPAAVQHPALAAAFKHLSEEMVTGPHRQMGEFVYSEAEERWANHNMTYSMGGRVRDLIKNAKDVQQAVDAVDSMYKAGAFGSVDKPRSKKQRDQWRKIALIHKGGNPERRVVYGDGPSMSMFMLDAMQLDKGQSGKYWSTVYEMGARAFAGYMQDKLQAAGRKNTYLVSKGDNSSYRPMGFAPYPEGEERERINKAFDAVFDVIRRENILAKALL